MSRKILKIGTDVLTLNNKLVSVKEDYPFWKVSSNTSEQYWNALKQDFTTPPSVELMMTPFEVVGSNTGGVNGMISASNGSIYTVPSTATTITKITPNPNNVNAPTITTIGTFANTANKFSGVHEVNGKLIFMPSSFQSIMILDLSNDSLSFIGSLGTTLSKFGKSAMADNGLIIAPANAAAQHLIFNPETLGITLQTAITQNATVQSSRGNAVNGGNGFIYMSANSNNNGYRVTKINTTTLVETAVSTSIVGDSSFGSGFAYDGRVYFYKFSTAEFIVFNTKDSDSRITFASGMAGGVIMSAHPSIGEDGWVYYFQLNTDVNQSHPHLRINPLNNTIQRTTTIISGSSTLRAYSSIMGSDGNLYAISILNRVFVYNFNNNKVIVPNRILSRYNIR